MEQQSATTTPLEMPDAVREALLKLADVWDRRSRGRFDDYDVEGSQVQKQGIQVEASTCTKYSSPE